MYLFQLDLLHKMENYRSILFKIKVNCDKNRISRREKIIRCYNFI